MSKAKQAPQTKAGPALTRKKFMLCVCAREALQGAPRRLDLHNNHIETLIHERRPVESAREPGQLINSLCFKCSSGDVAVEYERWIYLQNSSKDGRDAHPVSRYSTCTNRKVNPGGRPASKYFASRRRRGRGRRQVKVETIRLQYPLVCRERPPAADHEGDEPASYLRFNGTYALRQRSVADRDSRL
ncbi:hypothetical protein EVAR_38666_1 [Eumeta japonica]|uniref:Uncharacterized protein n=1 Tax=Eumeta variegata TaxID=151549 RepID=A0A4C1Y1J4_EUMVA|nr:hypothetical protein EVAR_38666_1 [Eumeta japonica]